jgi:hypothetical protein
MGSGFVISLRRITPQRVFISLELKNQNGRRDLASTRTVSRYAERDPLRREEDTLHAFEDGEGCPLPRPQDRFREAQERNRRPS